MVAVTAAALIWISRRRYTCPHCGRVVQWNDVNCPHCGDDMKFLHRSGPQTPRRVSHLKPLTPPSRSRRNRRG